MTEQESKIILEAEIKHHPEHCIFHESLTAAIKALERQIKINNMALIQSHRKCVLGRDDMYSDSTLQSMSKAELINLLHVAQHNYSVLLETFDGRVKYYEKELAAMSDEIKFEE